MDTSIETMFMYITLYDIPLQASNQSICNSGCHHCNVIKTYLQGFHILANCLGHLLLLGYKNEYK